jgi:hypothetical protein
MSWTDEEIDTLFGEAANKQVFEYKPEYWNDIEKQLPIQKKRKRAYWWWTANVFFLGFIGLIVFDASKKTNGVNQVNTASTTNHKSSNPSIEKGVKMNVNSAIQNAKNELKKNDKLKEINANSDKKDNFDLIINDKSLLPVQLNLESDVFSFSKTGLNDNLISNQNQNQDLSLIPSIALEQEKNPNAEDLIELVIVKQQDAGGKLGLNTKELTFEQIETQMEPVSFQKYKNNLLKMYVEIYSGVGQSYIKNETNANSINATIGAAIGLTIPFKRFNISAGLGIQATKFDQLNIIERTKVYGFGSQILENSYEFSSIYSLTIPLSATYSFGRHSLNAGLRTNVNIMTQLKHSQTLEGDFKSYSSGFSDVRFFNRFGLLPSVGYSFYVNEKTQIGVQLNLQLLQQIQSDRFIGTPLNLPIDGQIYLKRTLDF